MSEHRFQNIQDAHNYCFAGKATITLTSRKTEKHFTYKINQWKKHPEIFFVDVLAGGGEYLKMGMVDKRGFRTGKFSQIPSDDIRAKAFVWFLKLKELPYELQAQHEHTCGRCGRQLTHPESIDLGIGPECAKMVRTAPVVQIEDMHTCWDYNN